MIHFKNTWLVLEAREEDISMPHSPNRPLNPLLERKIKTADQMVPRQRLLLMLTRRSCAYVGSECQEILPSNVLIHPSGCGNAVPFAHCLMQIRKTEPRAKVIFIPSGNAYFPVSDLHFALRFAFGSMQFDRAKVFLVQSPLQRESNALVVSDVPSLLMLYLAQAPQLLIPIRRRAETATVFPSSEEAGVEEEPPRGDLYEDILLANPLLLRRLPILSRIVPGPIRRAAMFKSGEAPLQPTFH